MPDSLQNGVKSVPQIKRDIILNPLKGGKKINKCRVLSIELQLFRNSINLLRQNIIFIESFEAIFVPHLYNCLYIFGCFRAASLYFLSYILIPRYNNLILLLPWHIVISVFQCILFDSCWISGHNSCWVGHSILQSPNGQCADRESQCATHSSLSVGAGQLWEDVKSKKQVNSSLKCVYPSWYNKEGWNWFHPNGDRCYSLFTYIQLMNSNWMENSKAEVQDFWFSGL